jgi:putative hydrolase of the HAD superfamily
LPKPKAVLLDLDDTILDDSLNVEDCWEIACHKGVGDSVDDGRLGGLDRQALLDTIGRVRDWFWSDRERHRVGRLDLPAARREIVRLALTELGVEHPDLAHRIGDAYCDVREQRMTPFPGAIETVYGLREAGCKVALVTNGSSAGQRAKINKFDLTDLFDLILIEGEMGFGKPDPRVYERALETLAVSPSDAWMVGDNLEWDVAQPQRMGLFGVWVDFRGRGLPPESPVRPDLIVRKLADLHAEARTWR